MLGHILAGLTDAAAAEDMLTAVGNPAVLARAKRAAAAAGVGVGTLVAAKLRHVLDHAGEEIWLDLVGRMSGSPQPGIAALEAMLGHAFPDPVRVRITSSPR